MSESQKIHPQSWLTLSFSEHASREEVCSAVASGQISNIPPEGKGLRIFMGKRKRVVRGPGSLGGSDLRFVLPSLCVVASSFNPFSTANLCISVLVLWHVGQTDHAYPPAPGASAALNLVHSSRELSLLGLECKCLGAAGEATSLLTPAAFPPASLSGGQGVVTVVTVLSPGARGVTGDDCPGPGQGARWAETSLHGSSLEVREYGGRGARIPAAGGRLGSVTHPALLCPCCCEAAPGKRWERVMRRFSSYWDQLSAPSPR